MTCECYRVAGWSSSVARRAHNPKVVGSNPAPATRKIKGFRFSSEAFFRKRDLFPPLSPLSKYPSVRRDSAHLPGRADVTGTLRRKASRPVPLSPVFAGDALRHYGMGSRPGATGRPPAQTALTKMPCRKRKDSRMIILYSVPLLFFCRRLLLLEQILDTLQGNAQLRGRRERFRDLAARYDHKDIFITARIPQQDRQAIAVMQDGAASAEHLLGVRVFIVAGAGVPLPPAARDSTGRRKLLPALPSSPPSPGVSGPAGPIAST